MAKKIKVVVKTRIAEVEGIENGKIVSRETICDGLRSEHAILSKIRKENPDFAPARKVGERFITEKYEIDFDTFIENATKIVEE